MSLIFGCKNKEIETVGTEFGEEEATTIAIYISEQV
jgi:hypothetical protein